MLRSIKILTLLLLMSTSATFSQQIISFSGAVYDAEYGFPMADHAVTVTADDSLFINTYYTDENGYFIDSIQTAGTNFEYLVFETLDCKGIPHDTTVYNLVEIIYVSFFICSDSIPTGCQADFIAQPQGPEPHIFRFQDLSVGDYDQWLWDFGDSTFSQEQNPVHTYDSAGIYLVCLTISSNNGSCNSTLCQPVFVLNEDCTADFDYEANPVNPLKINFINLSYGNYTDLFWDFGDGESSTEENPVHIYPSPGDYEVCLAISGGDSLFPCYDFYCQVISLQGDTSCEASFIYVLDSLPNNPNTYYFYDQSIGDIDSWYWDFGDGNISFNQNPAHQYADSGQYQVCLTVSNTGVSNTCFDTYCTDIITPTYYNFGGLVWAGDYPLNNPVFSNDTGIVYLHRLVENQLHFIASKTFQENGYYWFTHILEGEYIIKVSLARGSPAYPDFIPTYFGDQVSWDAAQLIIIQESIYDKHIHLVPVASLSVGPGSISGSISFQGNEPAAGQQVNVLLTDEANNPLLFKEASTTGTFEFNNLPYGNYLLKADLAGRSCEVQSISISPSNPSASFIQVVIFETAFFGVEESDMEPFIDIQVYPNPAKDWLNVEFVASQSGYSNLAIRDILGKAYIEEEYFVQKGEQSHRVNVSSLPQGMYLLQISVTGYQVPANLKFIK
jgi:PKD repeat protein